MPQALAAAALGYSPQVAERHAAAAGGPWTSYAAAIGEALQAERGVTTPDRPDGSMHEQRGERGLSVGDVVVCRVLTHEPFGLLLALDADVAGASVDMISTFYGAPPPMEAWPAVGSQVKAAITEFRGSPTNEWVRLSINPDRFHVDADWARVKDEHPLETVVRGSLHGP